MPRFQFSSFYRFGNIIIGSESFIPASFTVDKLISSFVSKFKELPFFEYDDEYIVLLVNVENVISPSTELGINQIKKIIALSNQAKLSMENKIDNRIRIDVEEWGADVLEHVEDYFLKKEIEKGIEALWTICNLSGKWTELQFLSADVLDDLFLGIKERSKTKSREKQQPNLLVQALVYDRTEFFPKGHDGYLFDIFEVLCNNLEQGYQFNSTELFPWLMDKHIPGQANCWNLYKKDESNSKLQKIREVLKSKLFENANMEYALAWFFSQKDEIRNSEAFDKYKFLSEFNKNYNEFANERKMAVILLGAFLGYKYFYDALYDSLSLPFFKDSYKQTISSTHQILSSSTIEQANDIPEDYSALGETNLRDIESIDLKPVEFSKTKRKPKQKQGKDNKSQRIENVIQNELEFQVTSIIEPEIPITENKDEIPLEIIRNNPDEAKENKLLSEEIKAELRGKIRTIRGLKNNFEVVTWVIKCCELLKNSNNHTEKELIRLLLDKDKPEGFGKVNAEKIAKEVIRLIS